VSFSLAPAAKRPRIRAPVKEGLLTAADVGNKLLPEKVFFRGQIAPVQARNTGGVRYADGFSRFSRDLWTALAIPPLSGKKYQAYLINEVPVEIGGQTLKPGAYGIGFLGRRQIRGDGISGRMMFCRRPR